MPDLQDADQLGRVIQEILLQGPHEKFEKYWKLYLDSAFIEKPDGLYFRISQDATYRNLAIVGDSRIVDIEADETSNIQAISVSPCRTLSGVVLYVGSIPSLPRSQGSLLTVACRATGSNSLGPYWSAHNEEEIVRLRKFAKILVNSVSF